MLAKLGDGGAQLFPGGHRGFARNAVAVFAVAGLEPLHVARQAEQLVFDEVAVEVARGAGPFHAIEKFGQGRQSLVEDIARARTSIAQFQGALRFLKESCQAGVAVEAAFVPRGIEIAPLGQQPGRLPQGIERFRAVALFAPGQAREGAHQRGGGGRQALLDPALKDARKHAQGIGLRQFLKYRIDGGFHGTAPQQLRAKSVDGADKGAVERACRVGQARADCRFELGGAALFQLVTHAQLHVSGGGMSEGDGHDGFDFGAGSDGFHDASHERGGFAGTRGRFHHPALVELGGAGYGHGRRSTVARALLPAGSKLVCCSPETFIASPTLTTPSRQGKPRKSNGCSAG